MKSLLNNPISPILLNGLRTVSGGRRKWTGHYSGWAEAVAASSGYEADNIFQIVRNAALAVRDGQALWEHDSTCFYHEEYNWQLLACLMTVAARSGGALHVLDFDGALGSTYMQHQKILSGLLDCSWSVVEQPHIVACGKTDFAADKLEFFDTIDKCFSSRPVNVVLFSSVLQYLESPYNLLEEVVSRGPAAIIIDRTPMANKGERITVQHVLKIIYSASYPCRFLDKNRVQPVLTRSRTLTPWFASPVDPPHFLGAMSLLKKEDK